jgi:UDP-N-acetylglucosamine acyltransferase
MNRESAVTNIHPSALVHPSAELAEDVVVGPCSIIGPDVRIGARSIVGSHVLIDGHTRMGERNRVFHGAAIGTPPQDLSYAGERSYIEIGDDNSIREFVTIHPGSKRETSTIVGDHNLLMAYVHVAHDCRIGDHTVIANAVNLAGHVSIEDYAIIGGVTPVHQFVRVGCHAIIGGGSRAARDVAPYTKVAGNPVRCFGLNTIGLQRRGFPAETLAALRKVYRIFFRSKLGVEEACREIASAVPDLPEVRHFLAFVRREGGRGITR